MNPFKTSKRHVLPHSHHQHDLERYRVPAHPGLLPWPRGPARGWQIRQYSKPLRKERRRTFIPAWPRCIQPGGYRRNLTAWRMGTTAPTSFSCMTSFGLVWVGRCHSITFGHRHATNLPGLVAHQSALQNGVALSIPDLGDAPLDTTLLEKIIAKEAPATPTWDLPPPSQIGHKYWLDTVPITNP